MINHSLVHEFPGGYAAGYYSYKVNLNLYSKTLTGFHNSHPNFSENLQWAEVLSADAFSAFEDAGLDDIKVIYICF